MVTFKFELRPETSKQRLNQLLDELDKHDAKVKLEHNSLSIMATGDEAWRLTGMLTVALLVYNDVIKRQDKLLEVDTTDAGVSSPPRTVSTTRPLPPRMMGRQTA